MTERHVSFGKFELPKMHGLEYLMDEEKPDSDYLFINEPHDGFSMYFEKDFPVFTVPEDIERDYCLFELKRPNKIIKFFCPERRKNLTSVVWYFYVELFDEAGTSYCLPGQVRVGLEETCIRLMQGKGKFIEILEQVQLKAK